MFTQFYLIRSIGLGSPQDYQIEAETVSVPRPLKFRSNDQNLLWNGGDGTEGLVPPGTVDTLWLNVVFLLCRLLICRVEGVL